MIAVEATVSCATSGCHRMLVVSIEPRDLPRPGDGFYGAIRAKAALAGWRAPGGFDQCPRHC